MSAKKVRKPQVSPPTGDALFQRVAAILNEARSQVVRAVNTNMMLAYWLIGREIVQDLQGGEGRAEYGKQVVQELASRLTHEYGKGFSAVNLWLFRQFYLTFADRIEILYPSGREFSEPDTPDARGPESRLTAIRHNVAGKAPSAFSPHLAWSHDRALLRVQDKESREFYECEAVECGWTKTQLERQIERKRKLIEATIAESNENEEGVHP